MSVSVLPKKKKNVDCRLVQAGRTHTAYVGFDRTRVSEAGGESTLRAERFKHFAVFKHRRVRNTISCKYTQTETQYVGKLLIDVCISY